MTTLNTDHLCPQCGEAPAPIGITHAPDCPRLTAWEGLENNPTPGRLGEPSEEETMSQEADAHSEASHRPQQTSPGVSAHRREPVLKLPRETVVGSGVVNTPVAGQTIASIPAEELARGIYEVFVGTRADINGVTDAENMELWRGSKRVGRLFCTTNAIILPPFRVILDGSQDLRVLAIQNGGVTFYHASIQATRIAEYPN